MEGKGFRVMGLEDAIGVQDDGKKMETLLELRDGAKRRS